MTSTALVTGSSGGIGKAICQSLYDDGVDVIGLTHHKDDNTPWKNYVCDLSDIASLENTIKEIYQTHGAVPDMLVNNAGVYLAKSWEDMTAQEFEETMRVNAVAPFILSKFWAQQLIKNNRAGVCVNVSSVSGLIGSMDMSYAASKSALMMLTKTMAKSLAKNNIRVNAIAPGPVKTAMADNIPKDRQEKYKESIPMGRFGEVDEIVSLIRFLISENSSYMTGSVITIDGGLV